MSSDSEKPSVLQMLQGMCGPEQAMRLAVYYEGPRAGEDRNAWTVRCNQVLTTADRDWIISCADRVTELDRCSPVPIA